MVARGVLTPVAPLLQGSPASPKYVCFLCTYGYLLYKYIYIYIQLTGTYVVPWRLGVGSVARGASVRSSSMHPSP